MSLADKNIKKAVEYKKEVTAVQNEVSEVYRLEIESAGVATTAAAKAMRVQVEENAAKTKKDLSARVGIAAAALNASERAETVSKLIAEEERLEKKRDSMEAVIKQWQIKRRDGEAVLVVFFAILN